MLVVKINGTLEKKSVGVIKRDVLRKIVSDCGAQAVEGQRKMEARMELEQTHRNLKMLNSCTTKIRFCLCEGLMEIIKDSSMQGIVQHPRQFS